MNFPGENQGGFSHCPVIYREFCLKNLPQSFLTLSGTCACATWNRSFPRYDLRHSYDAIARPWCFASILDWLCFQLWRPNCGEWLLYSVSTLHPLRRYESEPICFGFFFGCKILRRSGCKLRVANQILHSMTCSNELHLWSKELCWWMFVSHNSMPHLLRYEMLTPAAV